MMKSKLLMKYEYKILIPKISPMWDATLCCFLCWLQAVVIMQPIYLLIFYFLFCFLCKVSILFYFCVFVVCVVCCYCRVLFELCCLCRVLFGLCVVYECLNECTIVYECVNVETNVLQCMIVLLFECVMLDCVDIQLILNKIVLCVCCVYYVVYFICSVG